MSNQQRGMNNNRYMHLNPFSMTAKDIFFKLFKKSYIHFGTTMCTYGDLFESNFTDLVTASSSTAARNMASSPVDWRSRLSPLRYDTPKNTHYSYIFLSSYYFNYNEVAGDGGSQSVTMATHVS